MTLPQTRVSSLSEFIVVKSVFSLSMESRGLPLEVEDHWLPTKTALCAATAAIQFTARQGSQTEENCRDLIEFEASLTTD